MEALDWQGFDRYAEERKTVHLESTSYIDVRVQVNKKIFFAVFMRV